MCILRDQILNFLSNALKNVFVFGNSADTGEMPFYQYFIWVFSVSNKLVYRYQCSNENTTTTTFLFSFKFYEKQLTFVFLTNGEIVIYKRAIAL